MPSSRSRSRLVGGIDEARRVEQDVDDVAGHDAQQEEDDDRNPEQGHEHQGQAAHDIAKHAARLLLIGPVISRVATYLSIHTSS